MDLYRQLADCIKLMDASSISYLRIKNEGFEFTLSKSAADNETIAEVDIERQAKAPPAPAETAPVPEATRELAESAPAAAPPASPRAERAGDGGTADPDVLVVRAPMLGTFYCAPEPGAAPFVRVGDDVAEGATIGLLEAMKMFTAVPAGVDGTIESIVVSDGDLVEYDQPIALIRTR